MSIPMPPINGRWRHVSSPSIKSYQSKYPALRKYKRSLIALSLSAIDEQTTNIARASGLASTRTALNHVRGSTCPNAPYINVLAYLPSFLPYLLPAKHHLITSCAPPILLLLFLLNIIPEITPSRPHLGLYSLHASLPSITIPISRRQTPNSHNVPTPRGAPYTAAQPTKAAATTISTLGGWPSRLRPAFRSHHLGHLEPNARFKHLPPFASFQ